MKLHYSSPLLNRRAALRGAYQAVKAMLHPVRRSERPEQTLCRKLRGIPASLPACVQPQAGTPAAQAAATTLYKKRQPVLPFQNFVFHTHTFIIFCRLPLGWTVPREIPVRYIAFHLPSVMYKIPYFKMCQILCHTFFSFCPLSSLVSYSIIKKMNSVHSRRFFPCLRIRGLCSLNCASSCAIYMCLPRRTVH